MRKSYIGILLAIVCGSSSALEEIKGHVTYLETTYLPSLVVFTLDSGSTSCPTGTSLKWQKTDQSNNKAVYATLMLASATGRTVRMYVNDGDTTCIGQYFHLLSN
jgi:hypothetical protein